MPKQLRENLLPILLISLVTLLALYQVSLFRYSMKWDILDQFFPCRYFVSTCFKNGVLPFWCPYINTGYPLHADPQSGLFYPVTWLIALVNGYNVYGIQADYLLHVLLGGFNFYFLLRYLQMEKPTAVVFAVVYSLCGVYISNASHLTWLVVVAWLPFIFLYFLKTLQQPGWLNAVLLSVGLFMALTGGYPGLMVITIYLLTGYGCWFVIQQLLQKKFEAAGRVTLFLSFAGACFLLLSAGYLYSFFSVFPDISRAEPVTLKEANGIMFTPRAAISFLFPFATASALFKMDTDVTMTNFYAGFLLFPLLITALWKAEKPGVVKYLLAVALISVAASFGSYFFVRTWLYYLPGMNMFRHAAIFRVPALFGLIILAAYGFQWLWREWEQTETRKYWRAMLGAYGFVLISVLTGCLIYKQGFLEVPVIFNYQKLSTFNAVRDVFCHIEVQALFQLVLVALLLLSPIFFKSTLAQKRLLGGAILLEIALAALMNTPATIISEVSVPVLQQSLSKEPKDFPVPDKLVSDYSHFGDGSTQPIWFNLSMFHKTPAHDGFNNFYLAQLDSLREAPERYALLSHPVLYAENDSACTLTLTGFEPGRVEARYSATQPVDFTLLQSYYKGWQVTCDGKPLAINKVHYAFMQVKVPGGSHQLVYTYKPTAAIAFAGISVAAFVAAVIFVCLAAGRNLFKQ